MNEQQILYFLTLVEEQSFSKAAKKLFVTQPSFSQYIMKLEQQLNAQLFDRSSSPIKLTKEGEIIYEAACKIRAINTNAKNRIASLNNLEMGSLSIGTTPLRGSTLLSKSIKQFHSNFPKIKITILEKPLIELQNYIQNSECDFAISSGKVNPSLFHIEQLASETLYLAMSPENPLTSSLKPYVLSEEDIRTNSLKLLETPFCPLGVFQNEKVILYEGKENITEATLEVLEETMQLPVSMRVRDMYTVFSFVLSNLGISLIPDTLIRYGNQKSHPDYYKIDHISTNNNIIMFFKQNRSLTKASLEYCKILKELIHSGTWRQ